MRDKSFALAHATVRQTSRIAAHHDNPRTWKTLRNQRQHYAFKRIHINE
jgi:hypothetical protein